MSRWAICRIGKNFPRVVLARVYEGAVMATKPVSKKPVITKAAPACAPSMAQVSPKTAKVLRPKKPVLKADYGKRVSCGRSHVPNAETRKALRDIRAGRNLVRYSNVEELFEDLGI
jgi:hypothetical protein